MEQVYTALPFDDVLVAMDLSGAALLGLLEKSISRDKGILQVSGLKVSYDVVGAGLRAWDLAIFQDLAPSVLLENNRFHANSLYRLIRTGANEPGETIENYMLWLCSTTTCLSRPPHSSPERLTRESESHRSAATVRPASWPHF